MEQAMCRDGYTRIEQVAWTAPSRRRLAASVCAVLLSPAAALSAQPVPPISRPTTAAVADPDWLLAVAARQALQQDPVLGPLNLGVTVCRRRATVWGVVSTPGQARRAEKLLRQLPGLTGVRADLRVISPDDPLRKILNPPAPPRPVPPLLEEPPRRPGALTIRVRPSSETVPDTPVLTTPPIAVPVAPRAPNQPSPPARPVGLATEVERLRCSDATYQAVSFELQGGIVRLRGSPRQAAAVMRLAAAVAQLPGVERVVVEGINESP
jgi:hypothetical protein